MENSKKIIIAVVIVIMVVAGCVAAYFAFNKGGNKEEVATSVSEQEEIVKSNVEKYLKEDEDAIEEVKFDSVKVYTKEEIDENELLKDYELTENDIVFEVNYELKIVENYEDMMKFTAATGEVDGQWVKNKFNLGILKYQGENDYKVENFGTGF